jgi:RHS repeat-associated protein
MYDMSVQRAFSNYKFTGKERDSESGLDYFGARFHASTMGRFMSPDPIAGQVSNPQSLNLYSYVRNNPLAFTDPTGMIVEWNDSKSKCKKGETVCRTDAQRAYEERLKQLRESKNEKDRAKGEKLAGDYQRLQDSKAVFEVTNDRSSGSNGGEITYQGNDHFTINLHGNDNYGLTDNQRLAHEFEAGGPL